MDKTKVSELLEGLKTALLGETKEGDAEEPVVEGEDGKTLTADMTAMVKELGATIADAIKEAKGPSAAETELRDKLLSTEKGLPGIQFPKMETLEKMQEAYRTSTDPAIKKEAGDNIIVSFFKAWVNYGESDEATRVFKALVEGTAGDGGYLVPAPLAAEVWRVLPDMTVMRRIARTIPMTADTLDLNSLLAQPEAYWVSEYAKKTTTSAEFDQKQLAVNKLVCLLPITHELLADANIPLAQFIVGLFAERIGTVEDRAFFIGSGTGQPRGINAETLTTVAAGGTFNFDDIIDLEYSVPQAVRLARRAAFVGNQYAIKTLRKVKDTNGDYIWRDGGVVQTENGPLRTPGTLHGYTFYEQNDLPQKSIFFGDWGFYIIGDRQQITVSRTDEGGDAWRRDATEFKAVERVDGRAVMTTPFAKLTF